MPVFSYQVVNTFPHDKTAFTEGLQFIDGAMYESTGMEGTSWVRRYDLATGAVQAEHVIDKQYFGEGSVVLADKIVSVTWKNQKGFIYDRATLAPKGEFTYQGEGWGMTTDGRQVFMSDGSSSIRVMDPDTLAPGLAWTCSTPKWRTVRTAPPATVRWTDTQPPINMHASVTTPAENLRTAGSGRLGIGGLKGSVADFSTWAEDCHPPNR